MARRPNQLGLSRTQLPGPATSSEATCPVLSVALHLHLRPARTGVRKTGRTFWPTQYYIPHKLSSARELEAYGKGARRKLLPLGFKAKSN